MCTSPKNANDDDVPSSDTPRRASLTDQWLATVERTVRQMRRDLFVTISLVVVPLIFIAVLVVLTQVFQSWSDGGITTDLNFTDNLLSLSGAFTIPYLEKVLFCSDPDLPTINGLLPCVTSTTFSWTCASAEVNLPVNGLCMIDLNSTYSSWSLVVLLYSNALLGNLVNVGSLDLVIAMQWAAQVANAGDDQILPFVTALSSLGFGVSASNRYDSMRCSGFLYFAPAAKVPATLLDSLNETSSFFRYIYGGTFETVEEAEAFIAAGSQPNWGLIQINDMETDFDVVIRLNGTALPKAATKVNTDYTRSFHYDTSDMYIASGFVALEKALLDFFVLSQVDKGTVLSTTYLTSPTVAIAASVPYEPGYENVMQQIAGPVIGFIVVLGFLYPFCHMVQTQVQEKELRIREAVQIMGVRPVPLYASYFTTNFLLSVVTALLVVVMCRLGVSSASDPFVLLLVLLVYLISLITLASMVAACFSSSRLATQLSPLIYFVIGMPVFALGFSSSGVRLGLSILSPTALASIISSYLQLSSGAGFGPADFQNPYIAPVPALTMMMLAIDCVLYALLALYFDAVLPRQWGTPKHPLFLIRDPFLRLRACCYGKPQDCDVPAEPRVNTTTTATATAVGLAATRNANGVFDDQCSDSGTVNSAATYRNRTNAGPARRTCVAFNNLVKQYTRDGKTFNALDHLCLSLYEHEVSVLLGPNGAGKSTLVNALTGMIRPDGGEVTVYGHSTAAELDVVRQYIGFCPQHNVLWEELTCREHLEYFGKIKGFRGVALASQVVWLLDAVGLLDKADQRAGELSGGQKRKLSVAIAFVGSEGVVILDEPTAGMDAGARRHTWKLLRELSRTTTILLTTHFMDEADLLGDRVALINRGRLQCCGSSVFLKSRLGSGYTIRAELPSLPNARALLQHLQEVVPAVELFSFSGREAQYGVPRGSTSHMPELLRVLEGSSAGPNGVEGFAVSGSTLEEVFLRLVRQQASEEKTYTIPPVSTLVVDSDELSVHTDAIALTQRQASSVTHPHEPLEDHNGAAATTKMTAAETQGLPESPTPYLRETREPLFPEWDESELIFSSAGHDAVGRTHKAISLAIQRAWDAEMETSLWRIWLSQFVAAWKKRWLCALRDRKLQFFQVLCPVICVLIAMLLQLVTASNSAYLLLEPRSIAPRTEIIASLCSDWFGDNATALSEVDPGENVSLMAFRGSSDLSYYMLDTWSVHPLPRYTAMQCDDQQLNTRMQEIVTSLGDDSLLFDMAASLISPIRFSTFLYNTSSSHSLAIGVGEFFSYLLKNTATQPDAAPNVRVATHAMPSNAAQRRKEKSGSLMLIAIVLCVPFVLLPSTPVGWVVKERECKARHIQRLSGLTMSAYWLGNLTFDLVAYVITCVLVSLLLTAFRRLEYVGTDVLGAFVAGLAANGLCSTLYSYVLSFLFSDHAVAALGTMVFNMVTGVILAIVVMVLNARQQLNGDSTAYVDYMCFGFRIFPCFSFSELLLNMAAFQPIAQTLGGTIWTWDRVGYPCLYMAAEVPVFALALVILEQPCTVNTARRIRDCLKSWVYCSCLSRGRHGDGDDGEGAALIDSDVEAEAHAVKTAEATVGGTSTDPVRVVDLVKVFKGRHPVLAVDDVTFAVRPGEVFSLLGTNGAGKTTTISILCQEQFPTHGYVRVEQYDTRHDRDGAMRKVGYCPQFDATLDRLTVREHLALYAGVRGVVRTARDGLVRDLMTVCGLAQYANVVSGNLSGGNRRKLSVAIALMGAPSVVCLDEPSAGMDPVARRDLWTAMETIAGRHGLASATPPRSDHDNDAPGAQCSVLLTTHHLEEVEALADRVGIMSHGRLRCIGTLPHLKRKFGTGYQLELRVSAATAKAAQAQQKPRAADDCCTIDIDAEWAAEDDEDDHGLGLQYSDPGGLFTSGDTNDPTAPARPEPQSDVATCILTWFPGAVQSEDFFGERLVFRLPAETTKLSDVFGVLNERGASVGITDYIVAHTSIEQVFLRFCNEDNDEGAVAVESRSVSASPSVNAEADADATADSGDAPAPQGTPDRCPIVRE